MTYRYIKFYVWLRLGAAGPGRGASLTALGGAPNHDLTGGIRGNGSECPAPGAYLPILLALVAVITEKGVSNMIAALLKEGKRQDAASTLNPFAYGRSSGTGRSCSPSAALKPLIL